MMDLNNIKNVYFIGIGGIGMSAIARFFNEKKAKVSGYDRTATPLTRQLEEEGMKIHYTDDIELADKGADLVVYTPAIPSNHSELNWFRENGYEVVKRSDVLQEITRKLFAITVAGTHGKTTVSTMIAYILTDSGYGCNAFLGGISVNYNKNFWSSDRDVAVIEADEYDRSFLKLSPDIAVLTAMDADHLDIYGTPEAMEEAFIQYTHNIKANGTLIAKFGLHRNNELTATNKLLYSLQNDVANAYAENITMNNGGYVFDVVHPQQKIKNIALHLGGMHNVENAIAAISVALTLGIDAEKIRSAVGTFKGIKRRFEYAVKRDDQVYIDDYAHHPEELRALIVSAKALFPGRKATVVFQPHLFSRTRDLADGFAESLSLADEVILLPIYPARELPIEGVTSEILASKIKVPVTIIPKDKVTEYLQNEETPLLITAGAGDIDQLKEPITSLLNNRKK